LGGAVAFSAVVLPIQPALAVDPPRNIEVHFGESGATIRWAMAGGVQGYAITIRAVGTHRSYGQEQVLGYEWVAPYEVFPGYGQHTKGYRFQVCSVVGPNTRAACNSVKDGFYVRSAGNGVSTANLDNAARKATSCLRRGATAALVTGAGGGILAAMVSWIPGVDAIAAGDVAFNVAKAGGVSFITCLVE
jgi:hypothetical protein